MKVRILSGNLTGTIQDLPAIEAEVAVQTNFGEYVTDEAPPAASEQPAPEEPEAL